MLSTLAPTSSRLATVPIAVGKYGRERGPIHAGNRSQHHLRRGHGRASVAGGDETRGAPVAYQANADAHRRIALGANGLHRFVLHADDFAGMHDIDGESGCGGMTCQLGPQSRFRAH